MSERFRYDPVGLIGCAVSIEIRCGEGLANQLQVKNLVTGERLENAECPLSARGIDDLGNDAIAT